MSAAEGVDITVAQDGGCIKKVLVEGEGDVPMKGMSAKVHYTGKLLDGTVFDSSRDRNEHFVFNLGKGEVIKGWDEGIATMKRGEKAVLTCSPEYAYGAAGSPPKIPPNSTLEFEVEMFDFYGKDCTSNNDGGVRLATITEGSGHATPREGASVDLSYSVTHLDRAIETRNVKFVLGDGEEEGIVPGLELALYKMKKGEVAQVDIKHPYAYGAVGNADLAVPGGADLQYIVTLKDLDQAKYSHEMEPTEKLEFAAKAKEMGTKYFKKGDYEKALKKYNLISEYLSVDDDSPDLGDSDDEQQEKEAEEKTIDDKEIKGKCEALLIAAYSNQALCHIKLSNGRQALQACDKVLELDGKNVKALFRKGQAAELNQDFEDAITYYKALLEVDAANTLASRQITICKNKVKSFKEKQKKMYSNLFSRTNFKEPEPTKDSNKTKPDFSDSESEECENAENTEVNV